MSATAPRRRGGREHDERRLRSEQRGSSRSADGLFPHRRVESLAWEAVAEAVRDAAIAPGDTDAIVVGSVFGPPGVATRVQRGMGIPGVPTWTIENACASGTSAYHEAVQAVRFGRFGCVLVLGVDQMSTLFSGAIVPEATDPEGAASLPLPGLYALQAQRYLDEFGVTVEQLAEVAVKNKRNGLDNPRAQLRNNAPTVQEVLNSRMIAEPLNFLQCCPTSDGAGAAIIGPERGNRDDLRVEASVTVSGALWDQRSEDVWGYSSVARTAQQAFAEAAAPRRSTSSKCTTPLLSARSSPWRRSALHRVARAPNSLRPDTPAAMVPSRSIRAAVYSRAGIRSARPGPRSSRKSCGSCAAGPQHGKSNGTE